jgi:hypothetical protein
VTVHGSLGINTKTPDYTIDAVTTDSNASLVLFRAGGAQNYVNAELRARLTEMEKIVAELRNKR